MSVLMVLGKIASFHSDVTIPTFAGAALGLVYWSSQSEPCNPPPPAPPPRTLAEIAEGVPAPPFRFSTYSPPCVDTWFGHFDNVEVFAASTSLLGALFGLALLIPAKRLIRWARRRLTARYQLLEKVDELLG